MYHGAELTSHAMLRWGAERGVELHFIDPGKPIQNAHVESYNGRARDEFLNLHTFLTIDQARAAAANGSPTTTRSDRTAPSATERRRSSPTSRPLSHPHSY
ncbi:MAG: transposase [Candidatus Eremiobacteraeota bacterium]|nr:transposase [Candidatus Eremiobacteraeota bacterium]